MTLEIEAPTAEAIYAAIQRMEIPALEWMRLCELMGAPEAMLEHPSYQSFWTDEDIEDFNRASAALIEKRFGPELEDYSEYFPTR